MSYQEYKQQYKNDLTPSRIKYTILFSEILHYYIFKLSNKRSWSQNNAIYFPITIFFIQSTVLILSKIITNGSNSHDKL